MADKSLIVLLLAAGAAMAAPPETVAPTPELLEFIGIWVGERDDWFDPAQLEGWDSDSEGKTGGEEDDV